MMASLFIVYLICQALILWYKENVAFTIMVINLAFCFLMLLHHSTDIIKVRL